MVSSRKAIVVSIIFACLKLTITALRIVAGSTPRGRFALFQREGMFRFDPDEGANREAAAGVSLQVFDVGSGSEAGFFERLHRAVAVFAAHELSAFCEGFVEGAWEPTATHLHLALRHHRWFLPGSQSCLDASKRAVGICSFRRTSRNFR